MNFNSARKSLVAPVTKKIVSLALLVSLTLSTVPVNSAFADVDVAATTTVSGVSVVASFMSAVRDMSKEVALLSPAEAPMSTEPPVTPVPATTMKVAVVRTYAAVPMTAYTSRPEETDDTPFITADGSHVRDGIVAANFLPFGTKVRIPALFGDKVFEVHDRMNKRYPYKMDFWMEDLQEARQFGVRRADIEIVKIEEAPAVEIALAK